MLTTQIKICQMQVENDVKNIQKIIIIKEETC